jgi:hypothetical protein
MEVVALIRCVFLHHITKLSDQFLQQQTNIKFCMKLGSNASDTCEMISEAYWEEHTKDSSVFEWHKWFKEGQKMWKMMKEVVIQDLTKPIKMLKSVESAAFR